MLETSRRVALWSLTLHVEHAHFVRVGHGNVENYLVSRREAVRAFGPQDHLGHVLEVWGGGMQRRLELRDVQLECGLRKNRYFSNQDRKPHTCVLWEP